MVKNGILRGKESDLGAEPPRIRLCCVPPPPPPPPPAVKDWGLEEQKKLTLLTK